MNSIDSLDKKELLFKYGKYVVILLVLVIILFTLKSCRGSYNQTEKEMIKVAAKYINDNNLSVVGSTYIDVSQLGEIDGVELCNKISGVLITNEGSKLSYNPYLKCNDYESKVVNNKNNFITLNGEEILFLNKLEVYEEKGYTLKADSNVVINGVVGPNVGVYTLTYNAYDDTILKGTAKRIVIRTNVDKSLNVSGINDLENPTITLLGDTTINLTAGEKYKEPGYKAVDYKDGKISRNVKVTPSKIETNKVGTIPITYTVTNSRGKTATVMRYLNIVNRVSNLNVTLINETNDIDRRANIKIVVSGTDFKNMILPNGEVWYDSTYTFPVSYNGNFEFKIYDIYGNVISKKIEVDNVDNVSPTGSCNALVLGNTTEVNVTAQDNKGISGYSYILDENKTDYLSTNIYKANVKSQKISVIVKDLVGNETTINCKTTIREETVVRGTESGDPTIIDTSEYKLVSAKNDTLQFAKIVDRLNIAQNHSPGYPDMCLSFAYYHAYMLYNGDNLNEMTAPAGAKYKYATMFKAFNNDNLQVVLNELYKEINAGRPVILHVNGNKAGTSRHYVTVVGYKSSVTSGLSIKGTDLLIIDSYDGKLERMDTENSRFIISGYDTNRTTYGYSISILK